MALLSCAAGLSAQSYLTSSDTSSVEWRDGRVTLRNEESGRLKVGPPPGYGDSAATSATQNGKGAEKKGDAEPQEKETSSGISAFYLETLTQSQVMRVAPVIGGVPIYGGGLPRMHAPGFRFMGLDVAPDFSVLSTYNDNIFLRSGKGNQTVEGDFIQYITPRVNIGTSNADESREASPDSMSFNLNTAPSIVIFQDHEGQNTINNNTSLNFRKNFSKTIVYISQTYSSVTGGNLEAGELMSNDWYVTDAVVQYELAPKLNLNASDKLIVRSYEQGYDSMDNMVSTWVTYLYSEKLQFGIGPSYGVVDADNGPNQQYQQGTIRLGYTPSSKLELYLQSGVERREFQKSSEEKYDIVFAGGGTWKITPKSKANLSINRRTQSSNAYLGQNVTVTGFTTSFEQKIAQEIKVLFATSYDHSEYSASSTSVSAGRNDDYYTLNPSLQWSVLEWWDVGFSYVYRQNFSSQSAQSSFENNVFTIGSTLRF